MSANRPLSHSELMLARWMLEHGTSQARDFLEQLDLAEVTSWKCECGCASINFQIKGQAEAPPGVHVIGDFICGTEELPAGIFIFESGGLLSGIEVYAMAAEAPKALPTPAELRVFG